MIVGTEQIAGFFGVTRGRITQLVKEGMPKEGRGQFEVAACFKWYLAFKINAAARPSESSDVNEARKKLYDAQVIKTELETSRVKREVIPADEHLIDMSQLGVLFSTGLDSIGGRLAAQLAGIDDPAVISEHLTIEVNSIRESVADAITSYSGTISNG